MMYTTVAEFAVKEAELSERLMKIGLMHDIPIMSIGDRPNVKSRMKFLAFVPRNSEQGAAGGVREDARFRLKGSQKDSVDKVKTAKRGLNRMSSNRKIEKFGKSTDKDAFTGKSPGNLTSRTDQSKTTSKSNHHGTKKERPGSTTAKPKGRGKQQHKSQEGNYPTYEKSISFDSPRAVTKPSHSEQSEVQGKKTSRRSALKSSRSLEYDMLCTANDEKFTDHASKDLHKDLPLKKEGGNSVNTRNGTDKLQKTPIKNLKRSFSSVELGRPAVSKKGRKKGKARFAFKRRTNSEDLELEDKLMEIMKDVESLTEEFEDGRVSSTPRKSPAVSPIHEAYKLTQSEDERIRFNAAFIHHLEESELKECFGTEPESRISPFPLNVFKEDREHFNAARECFHIYQTLEERGFRIPLKTLHRGLMTPTEMRILEEIRKSSKNSMDNTTSNELPKSEAC